MEYKGHKYEIEFCSPADDWREHAGLFRIVCAISNNGFYPTYAEAVLAAQKIISDFVAYVPQTKLAWLEAMDNCMIWTDYESCHLDREMVWDLLKKAHNYLDCSD